MYIEKFQLVKCDQLGIKDQGSWCLKNRIIGFVSVFLCVTVLDIVCLIKEVYLLKVCYIC